mgnify:FL=1
MLSTSQSHRNRVANLSEESPDVFMRPPPGMEDSLPHLMKAESKDINSDKDS